MLLHDCQTLIFAKVRLKLNLDGSSLATMCLCLVWAGVSTRSTVMLVPSSATPASASASAAARLRLSRDLCVLRLLCDLFLALGCRARGGAFI